MFRGDGAVLRIGELFLKGKNRHLFEETLERNLRRALAERDDVEVRRVHGRVLLRGTCDEDLLSRIRWVFGVSSHSPVRFCEKSVAAIEEAALALATGFGGGADATFGIAARRSDKSFELTSAEIGRVVGAAVAKRTGMGVDLERPDLSIGVEVGRDWTFLWTERIEGPGGLPVGTSGKALLLLSGGIDSPVAGHMLQKRGLELEAVYFHAFPYTGDGARDKVVSLARLLSRRQAGMRLHVVAFAALQELLKERADPSYLVLLYRRAMVRIAERIAARSGIRALATGESLGQVASQTLTNLSTVEAAATLPILRPLIAFDKQETIEIARRIGTFDISVLPHDDCCTLFVPKHPQTRGSLARVVAMERGIDWEALVGAAANDATLVEL